MKKPSLVIPDSVLKFRLKAMLSKIECLPPGEFPWYLENGEWKKAIFPLEWFITIAAIVSCKGKKITVSSRGELLKLAGKKALRLFLPKNAGRLQFSDTKP